MSLWQAGQAELDAEALMRHEVPGLAAEGSGCCYSVAIALL